jgi:hypothetical protein
MDFQFARNLSLAVALCLSGVVSILGCRANPAPDAGFVTEPALLKGDETLPFDGFWLTPGIELSKFKKVFVAPVDTSHVLKENWWERANFAESEEDELKELAVYFRDQVQKQFSQHGESPVVVVQAPDKDTLVVELAIVELVPTKAWLNLVTEIFAGAVDQGATAFEGRLRSGAGGVVISEFKDREFGQVAPISVADLRWYSHSKHTLDHWGEEVVEVVNRKPGERVARASIFTLRPW